MIKYLKNSEIDRAKWNLCVANASNASFYALAEVLDITSPNWDALVYLDYQAVFPLPWRKKMGIKYIYPPFFSTQLGLYSHQLLDVSQFINAIPKSFRYQELKLNTFFQIPEAQYSARKNKTYCLNLSRPYEELAQSFSKNHQRNIQKANQNSLTLIKAGDTQSIIDLFIANKGGISSFVHADYQTLHRLMSHFLAIGKAEVWSVYDEKNTLCAGGFFITEFGKTVFMFSGSDEVAKERRAMFFLFDQYIQAHASSNIVLDFGGSNDENLARFYAGFGSKPFFYDTIMLDHLGLLGKVIRLFKQKKMNS